MSGRTAKQKDAKHPLGLTDQQIRFCREYAKSLNLGDAYEKAGYTFASRNSRDSMAARLSRNVKIQAYLREVMNLDEVSTLSAVAAIAFTPITEVIHWDGRDLLVKQTDQWSDRAKLAVKKFKFKRKASTSEDGEEFVEIEAEVELYDRLSALDKLMRKIRLYPKDEPASEPSESKPPQDTREAARDIVLREVFGIDQNHARSTVTVPEEVDSRSITP